MQPTPDMIVAMPQLIIEQPGVAPLTVDLVGPETSFGRAETNSVVLIADEISRNHARIRFVREKTILDDLESLNGTYVNRQRIVERVLNDNDELWFGSKCRAVFKDDSEDVLDQRKKASTIAFDLAKIKNEMDSVTASMTMVHPVGKIQTDTPDAPLPEELDPEIMARAFRRLDALYKATQLISSEFDLQKRISDVLDLAMEVTNADRGFLMMKALDSDELTVQVKRDKDNSLESSSPSMGIARRSAIDGEPVLMADSDADSNFGGRESIIMQRIETAMCVPLRVGDDDVIGSLYVDAQNTYASFTEEDLELFNAMASQAAMAIENVRLYQRMVESEKKRVNLGRFLSPAVVSVIMNEDQEIQLGGDKKNATILYCDIRGFTPLSEGLSPAALVELLNEHFTAMTEIVFQYKGTLDKYIGDEVMALFGAPFAVEDDALLAVRAGIAMQERNAELNILREQNNFPTFHIGVGINSGDVFSGYIGSPERLDYTVMGDVVNTASRLCSVAKGEQILIGSDTNEKVKEHVITEAEGGTMLKGKSELVEAFKVVGLRSND